MSSSLPSVFGRYVLLHCIGRGGMGEVFLAKLGEIQGFEKPIVIKKILPQLATDQEFLRRFIEEAQIAIKLTHGNIVPVYEVGMVDEEYFLALQYVEGRDLRSVLTRCQERGRRLPAELCLYLVREISNGLAYAHRRTDEAGQPLDLVHCDISPPNILVSYEGEVKIIDFGVAKSAMQRAKANEELGFGKFGYMAPEQLLRGEVVDRRADIYSTGVILYEILTSQRLFRFPADANFRHVAREVTAGKITRPSERASHLTDQFDAVVMKALRSDRSERYQSAEEFRDEVQQHLYRMSPTISADALAAFVQELFAEEIVADRQMLRSLSQTDVEPFRVQISDGRSQTVSFALSGRLLGRPATPSAERRVPAVLSVPGVRSVPSARTVPSVPSVASIPLSLRSDSSAVASSVPPAVPPPVPLDARGSSSPAPSPMTRRLAPGGNGLAISPAPSEEVTISRPRDEMVSDEALVLVPMRSDEHTLSRSLVVPMRRTWAYFAAGGLGLAVVVGVASGLLFPAPEKTRGSGAPRPGGGHTSGRDGVVSSPRASRDRGPDATKVSATLVDDRKDSRTAAGEAGTAGTGPDGGLSSSPGGGKPPGVRRPKDKSRPGGKKVRPWPPSTPPKVSPRMVQTKFRQVSAEYGAFTRAYGKLLDAEWQQILFAYTYGQMDQNKYPHLNEMLDDLRRRMKRVREGGAQ